MPLYRFRCSCGNTHQLNLSLQDYKPEMPCPVCVGAMKRVYDNFNSKEGLTNNQKKLGATEKRIDSGKWMKEETKKRQQEAPPGTKEHESSEFWLGNEFKEGRRDIKDF